MLACRDTGGHMVRVDNGYEQSFLTNYVRPNRQVSALLVSFRHNKLIFEKRNDGLFSWITGIFSNGINSRHEIKTHSLTVAHCYYLIQHQIFILFKIHIFLKILIRAIA